MITSLKNLPGSAFELTLTIPWADVKAVYDTVFNELAAEIEVEGFRKGKAPKEVVASKIDKSKVYGEVVNRLLPEAYSKALEEHGIKPVISPKIQILSGEEEKDWQFLVSSAQRPTVSLNNYQAAIKEINAKDKIWTPEKGSSPKSEETAKANSEAKAKKLNAIIEKLLEVCQVELADVFVDAEVNRLLTQLVEDVRGAGLTFEQYLASSGQTKDAVSDRFHKQAETSLKLEFILDAVSDNLKVEVTEGEINAVIEKEPDKDKQAALREQSYALARILRRESTINRLLAL